MKFGLLFEHQLPKPWQEGAEAAIFRNALDQVELADRLGYDYAWAVEHHFLEEYSHSSAPEVFLAAASQRSKQIRIGHGIVLLPPKYNHPARVAERIATLDLVSNGRVEFGTGESASQVELEGFGVTREERRVMWRESLEQIVSMFVGSPYAGHTGEHSTIPCRNVVPKPQQKPHPPLWMACSSRESIRLAARLGLGVLSFGFVDPTEARQWVTEYYNCFRNECNPIGRRVNPNIAMVLPFSCHRDEQTAIDRGAEGFAFFQFAIAHYYVFGRHRPGLTSLWDDFKKMAGLGVLPRSQLGIGTPDQLRKHLHGFAEAGVDQVILLHQVGNNKHEHMCESLNLFATEVMPYFKEHEEAREQMKARALAPFVEQALSRRKELATVDEPPTVAAHGEALMRGEASDALRWQAEYLTRLGKPLSR